MNCKNPDYKEFCTQIYSSVPACEEIGKSKLPKHFSSVWSSAYGCEFIVQTFELTKLLVEKKKVTFRPEGVCMYPCIQWGDTVSVIPRNLDEVKTGDIAVYRRHNQLFAHRVIAKDSDGGQGFIITRPDIEFKEDDGPTYEKDILGIVSRIERMGKVQSTEQKDYPVVDRFFYTFFIKRHIIKQRLSSALIRGIVRLQMCSIYGKIVQYFSTQLNKELKFFLQAPINHKANSSLYKEYSRSELVKALQNNNSLSKWVIIFTIDSNLAGKFSFVLKPAMCSFGGWWLYEIKMRLRYRRTYFENWFFREACSILQEAGIKELFVNVASDNYLEKQIFKSMGFKEVCMHKDLFLKNKGNKPFERIIMRNSKLGNYFCS